MSLFDSFCVTLVVDSVFCNSSLNIEMNFPIVVSPVCDELLICIPFIFIEFLVHVAIAKSQLQGQFGI